jgi:D-alanyl-D-alanine carboxypeptidase/D-alanyl-D-alanine-endopeptidase (penicillin-binding protein 4)
VSLTRRALVLWALAAPAIVQAETLRPRPRPGPAALTDAVRPRPRPASPGQPDPADLIAAAELGGTVTFAVADAVTGALLEGQGPDDRLPPASVVKMVTALYALQALGPGHRFATTVHATGPVTDGTLAGDLILSGGGDPTLDTDRLGDLAARLAATGLRRVTGAFRYWDGALPRVDRIDAGQPEHVGYNPAIAGLNLNFNRVNFRWSPRGRDLTMDAEGARFVPPVAMASITAEDREAPLFTYAAVPGRDRWTVARPALRDPGTRWLPTRHPGPYAADVFRTLCAAQGIELPPGEAAAAAPAGAPLVRDDSEPLPDMLRDMLRFSTNLTAEVMGLSASRAPDLAASGAAMTDWARATFRIGATFADHSGLGAASAASARDLTSILVRAGASPHGGLLPGILRDIGMRDAEGEVIDGHATRVMGKSGTLNFVSNLAGIVTPPAGRPMAFAILCADPARRDALPDDQREDPPGGRAWTRRARRLHGQLISRWAALYGRG